MMRGRGRKSNLIYEGAESDNAIKPYPKQNIQVKA